MPTDCSRVAMLIWWTRSLTRPTASTMPSMVRPAASMRALPSLMPSTVRLMRPLISLAAEALRWARARTSPATTAKPRPCSPARAASTAAFRASRLVWKAMLSMTPMISPMRREEPRMCSMAEPTSWMAAPLLPATWRLWSLSWAMSWAVSAVCATVPDISSIEAAVCCRLVAWDSVRCARSKLPWAISWAVVAKPRISVRTSPTTARRLIWICCSRCIRAPMGPL
ncbi:MAG: hypothetical protein GAK34_01219 [Delftia tsuruhatensis]|nr:MAG: hypothetical protein GAK34_01219 [Delftia tsuruhatensis]